MDENWNNYFEYNENSPSGLIWKVSQGKVKSGAMAGAMECGLDYTVRVTKHIELFGFCFTM